MSFIARREVNCSLFRLALLYLLGLCVFLLSACNDEPPPIKVDLTKRVPTESLNKNTDASQFKFGIGSMITPKEGYSYYQQLINYVGEKMGQAVRIVDRGTYEEINSLLEHGQLDAAFVSSGPYVEGKDKFGLKLLATPETDNGTFYFAYLIVPASSPARSLGDLRGKRFAFTDPKSNSGMIVPSYWLAQQGETPDSFFAKHILTYAHDASIQAVIDNLVDGASVESLIWDYLNNHNPEVGLKTRIIKRSEPFGTPPLVVRPDLPPVKQQQLSDVLLNMHHDAAGRRILDGMKIKRFVPGKDSDYDSIRKMRTFIQQQHEGN